MLARSERSRFQSLVVIAAGLLGTAVLAIGLAVWWLRADDIRVVTSNTGNLATVLAEQTNLAVKSIDVVINEIQERFENLGALTQDNIGHLQQDKNTYNSLTDSLSHLSHAALIALIDKNGRVVTSTQAWPPPTVAVDVTNRDYFQHFKNNNDKGIYVGNPVADYTTGLDTIFIGKRINDSNNAFLGIIIVGVRVAYFQHIYNSITSLPDQKFMLLRHDGTVILRYPDSINHAGEMMPEKSPWHRLVSQGGGAFRSPGYFDGKSRGYFDSKARLVAVRPLSDYPLVINVGVSETAALASWRIHALTIGIGTLLVIICTVFLLRALTNHIKRLVSSEAALADEQTKVDAALSTMSQGLVMFDSSARLVVCNQRYLEMYGLSPEIAKADCTLHDLLRHRDEIGSVSFDDPEKYMGELLGAIGQGKIFNKITTLTDGRIISVVNHPMADGGWVATHEDVTEKVRTEKLSEQQKQQLDAALENMSQGLCMFDGMQRLIVCNKRYAALYGLSDEQTKPGTTLRAILNHRIAHGNAPDDHESYINDRINEITTNKPYQITNRLSDGRYIYVIHRPMADGGWVATHEDITEIKRAEERIVHVAHHDALTGLPNRILFAEQLEQALKRVRRGERLAVLYIDVDQLKRVNDTLGHPIGDKLLKGVADRLRSCIRDIDTAARLSGDEFAIIQSSIDRPSDAAALALRIGAAIREPIDLNGHHVVVDTSIGISIAPDDGTELNELVKTADIALYEAKNTGRGTYCFYETEMNERMQVRGKLEHDLRSALTNGEFELFYQPIVRLQDNKITSFEALLRWHHPERGMISPAEFIPIAEEMGLIIPLGEWVLRTACAEAATWPDQFRVAINVSPRQFKTGNFVSVVKTTLEKSSLPASRLELEVTELVLIQDNSAALAPLHQLKDLGIRIAMDDFGTGYSSLSFLRSFPFDKIKIDQSFIWDLSKKRNGQAFLRAVIGFSRSLGIVTTAEGVETKDQLEFLRTEGCTEAQGYFLSRPKSVAETRNLLTSLDGQMKAVA